MFETLGLGVDFQFRNSGQSDMYRAMADMNNLYSTASRTEEEIRRLSGSFDTFTRGMQSAGLSAMFKGVGITLASVGGIMKAADFETQFAGMLKYMSDTSVNGIRSFNEQLSNSAKWLGITKEAVMGAAEEYMAMGLAQDKALEMAEAVSYAGKVWDVLPSEAASAFKGIAASYNLDLLAESTRTDFIDMVNSVADYTALSGQDTLNFLSNAGAGLKLIGRTDMAGAMGIAAAARRAEVDITHLGYGMRQITKTYADKGDTIFSKIGVDVRDATGQLKPFDQAMAEASKTINNYSQDVQSAFAMDLGQRYSDDLLRVLGGWEEYDKTMQIITSGNYAGSAAEEWSKITNTFEHNANVTKVIWSDFIQATFGQLLPILSAMLKPFNKVFDAITKFVTAHPLIGKLAAGFMLLSGVLLIVGGGLMFLTSKLAIFATNIASAGGLMNVLTGGIRGFGMVMSGLKPIMLTFMKNMVGLAMTFGALYFIWKYDILGIRSVLEGFVTDVKTAFTRSNELVKKNAVSIKTELANMDVSNNFVDRLTAFFSRITIAWDAIKDLWSDYTISDEMYDKLVASGMEPTVTAFMMLVYKMRNLWKGFKDGFVEGCNLISNAIKTVLAPPFVWLKDNILKPVTNALMDFLLGIGWIDKDSALLKDSANQWEALGKNIGFASSFVVTFLAIGKVIQILGTVGKVFGTIFSWIGKLLTPLKWVWNLIKIIGTNIGGIISSLGTAFSTLGGWIVTALGWIGGLVTAILGFFGIVVTLPAWLVGLITVAVVAAIAAIVIFWDEIKAGFIALGNWIGDFFVNLWNTPFMQGLVNAVSNAIEQIKAFFKPLGDFIKGVWDVVIQVVSPVIKGIATIWQNLCDNLKSMWDNISSWFVMLWEMTVGKAQKVWDKITEAWDGIVSSLKATWDNIVNGFNTMKDKVVEVFAPIVQQIQEFWGVFTEFIGFLWGKVQEFGNWLSPYIQAIGSAISSIWQGICDFFIGIWNGIVDFFVGIWTTVADFFTGIWNAISGVVMGVISGIWNFITSVLGAIATTFVDWGMAIWNTVVGVFNNIWNTIVGVFTGICDFIGGIWNLIWGTISNVLMGIMNTIMGKNEEAKQNFSNAWQAIKDGVSGIINGIWETIKSVFSGIVNTITTVFGGLFDIIAAPFKNAWDWLTTDFIPNCANVGKKIVDTIASGIKNAGSAIWNAIKSAFGKVADWLFPHSDAKTGPFSDLTGSGMSIPATIASGITANADTIYDAVAGIGSPTVEAGYNVKSPDIQGLNLPALSANYNVSKPNVSGLNLPDISGNVELSAKLNGLNQTCDAITTVFVNILAISKLIAENFVKVNSMAPSMEPNLAYAGKMNAVYDNRVDNTRTSNNDGMNVIFEPGAFQIEIKAENPESVRSVIPELKEELESTVVDIVRKMKDEKYEF